MPLKQAIIRFSMIMTSPLSVIISICMLTGTLLLLSGLDAIVENFTCYGLGTYNTICAGETVECKCKTTTALHLWNIHPLNEICGDDVFHFYAQSRKESSCGGFTVTYNDVTYNSTLKFRLNESESVCVECQNGNETNNIVNSSRNISIHDPGELNPPTNLTILFNNSVITLSWDPPDINSGCIVKFMVYISGETQVYTVSYSYSRHNT